VCVCVCARVRACVRACARAYRKRLITLSDLHAVDSYNNLF